METRWTTERVKFAPNLLSSLIATSLSSESTHRFALFTATQGDDIYLLIMTALEKPLEKPANPDKWGCSNQHSWTDKKKNEISNFAMRWLATFQGCLRA